MYHKQVPVAEYEHSHTCHGCGGYFWQPSRPNMPPGVLINCGVYHTPRDCCHYNYEKLIKIIPTLRLREDL